MIVWATDWNSPLPIYCNCMEKRDQNIIQNISLFGISQITMSYKFSKLTNSKIVIFGWTISSILLFTHTVIIQHSSNTESQQSPNYLLWWLVNGMNVCVCGICVWPLKSLDREWIRALLASAWKKQHMSGWNDPAAAALNQSTKDLVIMICRQYTWMDRNSIALRGRSWLCVWEY